MGLQHRRRLINRCLAQVILLFGLAVLSACANNEPRPQLHLQLGHGGRVRVAAFTADGRTLISAGEDELVKLWDVGSGDLLSTLEGQQSVICSLAVSPDARWIASCASIGSTSICLWDAAKGTMKYRLRGHSALITRLAFTPDSQLLASGGRNGEVRLWDMRTGAGLQTLDIPFDNALQSDIYNLLFTPDGRELIASCDKYLRRWDVRTGAILSTRTLPAPVASVALSPDNGRCAYSYSQQGWQLDILDLATDTVLCHIPAGVECSWLAFSPNGEQLWSQQAGWGPNTLRCWDARSGQAIPLPASLPPLRFFGWGVESDGGVAISADGKLCARPFNTMVEIEETGTRKAVRALGAGIGRVYATAFSKDGTLLATGIPDDPVWVDPGTGAQNHKIALWDLQTGELVRMLDGKRGYVPVSLALSSDGEQLAAGMMCFQQFCVQVWDLRTGALIRTFSEVSLKDLNYWFNPPDSRSVRFSPDGTLLAVAGLDNSIRLWEMKTGTLVRTLEGHASHVGSFAFSPDGKTLASANARAKRETIVNGEVITWDVASGKRLRTQDFTLPVAPIAFSPDGSALVCGGLAVRVLGTNGEPPRYLARDNTPTLSLAFSPDGTLLAFDHGDKVELWDVKTWTLRRQLTPGAAGLTFSPDGRLLAGVNRESASVLWDVKSGRQLATFLIVSPQTGEFARAAVKDATPADAEDPSWLVTTPEGFYRSHGNADYVVKWQFSKDRLIPFSSFEPVFGKPELVAKALRGEEITEQPLILTYSPPTCRFLAPVSETTVKDATVRVLVEVSDDHAVNEVKLTLNGRSLQTKGITIASKPISGEGKEPPAYYQVLAFDVPLPPWEERCVIQAVAYDDEQFRNQAAVVVRRPQEALVLPDLYLLCVGVSQYRNPLYTLSFPAADATALATLLKAQQGKLYAHVYATVLPDEKASLAGIRAAVKALGAAREQDTVVVFLSGHGVQQDGRFFFAPYEIKVNELNNTALPWSQLLDGLSATPATKLLFMDACHSGAKLGQWQATSKQLADAAQETGIIILASSSGSELSIEDADLGHGVFTAALLEALSGNADYDGDALVTVPELITYVSKRTSQLAHNVQHPYLVKLEHFDPQTSLVKLAPK